MLQSLIIVCCIAALIQYYLNYYYPSTNDMASSSSDASPEAFLPKNIVVSKYNVTLTPDLEKFTFDGSVEISLSVVAEGTNSIVRLDGSRVT